MCSCFGSCRGRNRKSAGSQTGCRIGIGSGNRWRPFLTTGRLVVLGLGSNQGNSREILESAVIRLKNILGELRVSSFYITSPRDNFDQPDFLNMVISGFYAGSCRELLETVQRIEADFGRNRKSEILKGPRTLDIDIELFGDLGIQEEDLVVPHRELHNRQFVLVPLLELYPDFADPVTGVPYRISCGLLPDQGVKKDGRLYGF